MPMRMPMRQPMPVLMLMPVQVQVSLRVLVPVQVRWLAVSRLSRASRFACGERESSESAASKRDGYGGVGKKKDATPPRATVCARVLPVHRGTENIQRTKPGRDGSVECRGGAAHGL
jgi:hypothetical protein